jgi:hypothetical protein
MEHDEREIVERLIAYWSDPTMTDDANRRDCRQIIAELASSLSAVELMEFQEEPLRHRQRIEETVANWLAAQASSDARAEPIERPKRREPPVSDPSPPLVTADRPRAGAGSTPGRSGASRIEQHNRGETVNSIGEIHSLHSLTFGAPAARTSDREERPAVDLESSAAERMVRILFLGANPADSTRLRLDQEVREIDHALATAELGSRVELCQKWAVRTSDLQGYLLRTKPRILHFSGHGSESAIVLEGDRGISRPVEGARLARLLANFNQRLRCVVLNACYSAEQAEAIAEHIDCVVGMAVTVADRAAVRFAAAFYLAVASGCSVQEAFDQACADIDVGERGQDEVPRLVARRCDPARVILVRAG